MKTLPKKVHMSGIGGIGMSALAQYLLDRGVMVAGSDRAESPVTDMLTQKGIHIAMPQRAENVAPDTELLIYTEAVPADNPERVRAAELGIPQLSYFDMLGEVSRDNRTVAVAGTHGKTTTTGMLTKILVDAHISPTAIVGSITRDFGSNYVPGTSDWFVAEACEYRRDFLSLNPEVLVITNIELDHTDYYTNLADMQNAFRTLAEKVPAHGAIITNPTHPTIAPILEGLAAPIFDYTTAPAYELSLPGEHNQMNAKAAAVAASLVAPSITAESIATSLAAFSGTWRRFEKKGSTKTGAEVYDDYAHHPTAIKTTLAAVRAQAQGRVLVAFHPHLFSRTRDLFQDFASAFTDADKVFIAPIYAAREVDDGTLSNETLAAAIRANDVDATALDMDAIYDALLAEAKQGDVVMTMGAGDIYQVADRLVA